MLTKVVIPKMTEKIQIHIDKETVEGYEKKALSWRMPVEELYRKALDWYLKEISYD